MIGKAALSLVAVLVLFCGSAQTDQQPQRSPGGALQISWVDPEEVTVRVRGPGGYSSETVISGGQVFADLVPGTYELVASKEGYQILDQKVEVAAGRTTDTSLTLREGPSGQPQTGQGVLQITWVDPEDVTVQVSGPDGYANQAQITGGQVFAGLSPGLYKLAVSKEGFQNLSHSVQVSAGETASTSLVLQRREGQGEADQGAHAPQETGPESATEAPAQPVGFEALMTQGAQLYRQAGCSSCHGGEGGGSQGPRLSGNERLQDAAYVAGIVTRGRGGMPGFGGRLSDEDIASVGTFIRNSWENDFGLLSPREVQQQR